MIYKNSLLLFVSLGFIFSANSFDVSEQLQVKTFFMPENCDAKSKNGDTLSMHYTGKLTDGTKFDSSLDRNKPFKFTLGNGEVIKGWDEGLQNMCIGEKRSLIIPPELGYGSQNMGPIPADSTLHMDVELIDILEEDDGTEEDDAESPHSLFIRVDTDEDGLLSQDEVSEFIKESQREISNGHEMSEREHNEIIADIFSQEDVNKDGFISLEEFGNPAHDEL